MISIGHEFTVTVHSQAMVRFYIPNVGVPWKTMKPSKYTGQELSHAWCNQSLKSVPLQCLILEGSQRQHTGCPATVFYLTCNAWQPSAEIACFSDSFQLGISSKRFQTCAGFIQCNLIHDLGLLKAGYQSLSFCRLLRVMCYLLLRVCIPDFGEQPVACGYICLLCRSDMLGEAGINPWYLLDSQYYCGIHRRLDGGTWIH